MANFITDVARELSKSQETLVDNLTEQTPLMDLIPFEKTTHGLSHAYESLEDVTEGSFIDIDGDVPDVGIEKALKKTDLSVLAGKDTAGIDKVNSYGGHAAYIEKRLPTVLRHTGMKVDAEFYYNVFQQTAIDVGNAQQPAVPSTGSQGYSMTAIRFESGVCTGLYDAGGFGNGKNLVEAGKIGSEADPLWVGNQPKLGYHIRGYLGALVASSKNVATVVNIDIANIGADSTMPGIIDEMLLQVRSGMGNTVIVMHPRLKNKLHAFKGDKLQINVNDPDYKRAIDLWEGVPIIGNYNLLEGTEGLVTI